MVGRKGGEKIVGSYDVRKITESSKIQERFLLITNYRLLICGKDWQSKPARRHHNLFICGFTYSSKNNSEFVIHISQHEDYYLGSPAYKDILKCLKAVYYNISKGDVLKVYLTPEDNVSEYRATK